jgi:hypothetical protein
MTTITRAHSLEPASIDEASTLAKAAVASRLYAVQSAEAALMILLTGRDLGLTASQSLRAIHVISGKPVVSADALVAAVRRSGLCASWRVVESTPTSATIETKRLGEEHAESETFTWADAERAGLTRGDNYRKWPREMLRHRCAAALARRVYPDAVLGCYDPGELPEEPQRATVEVVRLSAEQVVEEMDREIAGGADPDEAYERAKRIGREHRVATRVQSILNDRERAAAAAKRAMLESASGVATVAPIDPYDRLVDELSQVDSPAAVVTVWQENRSAIKDLPAETRARAWSEVQAAWSAYGGLDGVNGLTKAVLKGQPAEG